jgi:D-cysteine desulfhydrase/L-cysteate sulfo-lyase
MGATIHYYPVGEDENGADQAMLDRADVLRSEGREPYVIPLSNVRTPYGALGYVEAAEETLAQLKIMGIKPSRYFLPTGSASTHAGFLLGLRASACDTPVNGICVRRDAVAQQQRVKTKIDSVGELMDLDFAIDIDDINCDDRFLAPGYGMLNDSTIAAIKLLAQREGILLDPTYSGKAFAALIDYLRTETPLPDEHIVFLHTGGTASLFGYPELVESA